MNKDTVVNNLNGFKNSVKFGELIHVLSEVYGEDYDLDEFISSLNDYGGIEEDDFIITYEDNYIDCCSNNNYSSEKFSKVLSKVFQEEIYVMESDRFTLGKPKRDGYGSYTLIDDFTFRHMYFVSTSIMSSDGKIILSEITKDHTENEIRELTINNFFQSHEKELFEKLEKKDDVERCYNAHIQFYYIRKKDFKRDKWWLGWTSEND